MSSITRPGQAGTLESNDILITVAPIAANAGIAIELTSPVVKQYGNQICRVIKEELAVLGVKDARVQANDKGALDCTIRARIKTAVERAQQEEL